MLDVCRTVVEQLWSALCTAVQKETCEASGNMLETCSTSAKSLKDAS